MFTITGRRVLRAAAAGAAIAACAAGVQATDVSVSRVEVVTRAEGGQGARVTLAWSNSWRNERNFDAAWVFVKARRVGAQATQHIPIGGEPEVAERLAGPAPEFVLVPGGTGVFVQPAEAHRGEVRWTIDVPLGVAPGTVIDPAQTAIEVYAIEMVHVPAGGYWLGDTEPTAHAHAAFYRSAGEGRAGGLYRVEDEAPIEVGPEEGRLWYTTNERSVQYEGDRGGPVPEAFPKGTRAFYCMKYELSQGEYAAFLNGVSEGGANARAIHASVRYAERRGTISIEGGRFVASSPQRPCNFVSWEDACAWTDWAGLRPMTELEFTKACRGGREPAVRDFPWGTSSKERLRRVMDETTLDLRTGGEADESLLRDETREVLGASEWWIMDLAGSVWERCVTIGHPAGRAFVGSHGDGRVTAYARATNEDWPKGDEGVGGYGYRGGGYYEPSHHATPRPDEFNPWSPVEWRRFGSWGDGPRTMAYGYRAVRSGE